MPDIIPEATVVNLLRDVRQEWMSKPEQLQARNDIVGTSDHRRRTMTSRWRAMLKAKYGGALWCQVLISTGTIPPRMLELANSQLAQLTLQQKQPRAPASSRGPASAASAGAPIGSQHVVSVAKRQRQHANKLNRVVREELRGGARTTTTANTLIGRVMRILPNFSQTPSGRPRGPPMLAVPAATPTSWTARLTARPRPATLQSCWPTSAGS